MKSYKLLTQELSETIKRLKAERGEDIKEIKGLYSELDGKQIKPFDQVLERISKNLQFFKETEYKNSISSINTKEIVHKYDGKLQKINEEIAKLDKIIKNGCGNVVEKPPSSRIKTESYFAEREISQIQLQESGISHKQQ